MTSPGKAFKISGKKRFQVKEREKYIRPHSGEHPCTFRRPTCDATEGMLAWFVGILKHQLVANWTVTELKYQQKIKLLIELRF